MAEVPHERQAGPLADDTAAAAEAVQLDLWRRMPSEERFRRWGEPCMATRHWTEIGLRQRHPNADDDEIRMRLFATWLDRETMMRCYG